MTIEGKPNLSDDTYKKYSLEQLTSWIYDAMSVAEPEEVAKVILQAIQEDLAYHNRKANECQELIDHLSRNKNPSGVDIHYDGWDSTPTSATKPDYDDIEESNGDIIFISDC